jgi:ectoine hydroxylase-related dioxygenase (phytanoyl-CoA dioxygenase family)
MPSSLLSDDQVQQYREAGFVVVPSVLGPEEVLEMRRVIDEICAGAAGLTKGDDIYDLEDSHTPEEPKVRRIKNPTAHHRIFDDLMRDERILGPLKQILGPSVRFKTSKLNMKSKGYGAPVEWHQDWAFYPHTNDDVTAVGVFLNDVGPENGPLNFLPGSHRGPTYDHHHDGIFCGAVDIEKEGIDLSSAVPCIAPAGSVSFHHVRMLHGSDANRSDKDRALLLYEMAAGDAFPISGGMTEITSIDEFNAKLLCGEPTLQPRMADVPVRIPLPRHSDATSIYQSQGKADRGIYKAART